MKLLKSAIIASTVMILLSIVTKDITAQQWVTDMQDTSLTLAQKQASFNAYWDNREYEKGKGFKQFKRKEYFQQNRIGENGKLDLPQNRITDYRRIQKEISTAKSIGVAGQWVQLGPFGPSNGIGSGRINCVDFHPTNSNKIIIGAPSGGIWRSDNGGTSWTTNTDDLASIGISDIKYAPSDASIIYVATGDIDGDDTYSIGILKSTDGGNTWNTTGLSYNYQQKRKAYRLLVHPTNPDIVYASTSLGFYKSTDGGITWTRKKLGTYKDIEFKPGDPNTIYIASSTRVIVSTNGGDSFTNKLSISGSRRVEIAVTPNDPNYVYALSGNNTDGGFNGIYQSTDAGSNFTLKASSPNLLGWSKNGSDAGGQAWYDLALTVSPTNKNKLFVGGVNMWTSNNGGSSWNIAGYWIAGQGVPYTHADIHMIRYNTHNSSEIWACTDGGVSKSTDNGSNWNEKNNQLAIAQMYRMGGSKTIANKILTGWQDNGSNLMTSNWNFVLGGDGMECIISHSSSNTMYGSLYYGNIRRSYDGGNNWSEISNSIPETGAWVTPYIMDDNNANILIAGYDNVWKTVNKGNNWTKISSWSGGKLNTIAATGNNTSTIWTANNYSLYKTTDGGTNWTTISGNLGSGQVNSIAINKANPNKVWVCKSGFYDGQKVYQTIDGGATWTNISGSLPNYPVNTIVNAPNTANGLYVGTDMGVYYYDTNLGDWVPFMKDLPNVIVSELELFETGDKIRAATYGRGLWESVTYPFATNINNSTNNKLNKVKIYPNPAKDIIYIELNQNINTAIKLTIINSIGSIIDEITILNNDVNSINTSKYPKGIYFFKLISDTHYSINKVIIQ
ncbi:MAG: hypothetical protein DRI86_00615 [Bacteroidetes bacterium]|nr:MAG: hypothetical protein DRI86_00615 [Bacteroidota bacterium]